jgi:hypothetical protein
MSIKRSYSLSLGTSTGPVLLFLSPLMLFPSLGDPVNVSLPLTIASLALFLSDHDDFIESLQAPSLRRSCVWSYW